MSVSSQFGPAGDYVKMHGFSMIARLLSPLDHLAEVLVREVEKRKLWLLSGFSILYFTVTCLLASRKLMWNDELFTFYISRLSSISEVWSALLTGAEQLPPFFYAVTRASLALFGVNNLSIRLPEVLGFWVMGLCLFRFVSKRSSALYGFIAMLFPLVTSAYYYSYEARPYGLVLGFSSLALICWQAATEGHHRKLALVGLTISLAAAVSSHYYAVFVLFPLVLGEVVRYLSRRRLDLPVWVALGLALTPLVLFLPLIERATSYSANFWAKSSWMSIPNFYYFHLAPAVLSLMAMLILSTVYLAIPSSNPRRQNYKFFPAPPFHEIAAALGFIAIPVIAVISAKFVTGAFTDRYALPAVIGFSLLVAFAAYRLLDGWAIMVIILVLSLCSNFIARGATSFKAMAVDGLNQEQTNKFLQSQNESSLPIVAADPHTFIMLAHYGSRDIASRVVYLADPGAALRHLGHNSVEKGMLDLLRPWFRLKVEEYGPYVASQRRFFVYGSAGHFLNWLFSELKAGDMQIELKGRNEDALLFLVSPNERFEEFDLHHSAENVVPSTGKARASLLSTQ